MSVDAPKESTDGLGALLAGVGVGIVLGGLVALLLAPGQGIGARKLAGQSADDALDHVRRSMADLKAKVDGLSQSGSPEEVEEDLASG